MKTSDWISVNDRLPEADTMVLICTTNNKCGISSMYVPKDCYGKVLGEKEWRGSGAMRTSITHWQPIVLPQQEEVMNDKPKVCVVHIETRRFFDECQRSYLPVMYPIPSCNDCQYSDPECKRIPCNQCDRYSHFRMHKGCIADLMALTRGIVKIVKQHNKK